MRRIILLMALILASASCIFAQDSKILERKHGSITFVVDENLPAPKQVVEPMAGADVAEGLIYNLCGSEADIADETGIIASSLDGDSLIYCENINGLYQSLVKAFEDHRPITLTPDVIWIVISQGLAYHVNTYPEQVRDRIVDFQGKKTLLTIVPEDTDPDWETLIADFARQIGDNVKTDLTDMMTANFSTSTVTDLAASRITLMNTVKSFFEYVFLENTCGIPYINLMGTPKDWEKVLEKTRGLEQYGLGWWVKDLEPILEQFIQASKGKPDQDFWKSIVMKYHPGETNRGGCLPHNVTELDGWMLKLFPFTEDGRTPATVSILYERFIPEMVMAPANYVILDPISGKEISNTPIEIWGGIVGYELDRSTNGYIPKTGWIVRRAVSQQENIKEYLRNKVGVDHLDDPTYSGPIGGELTIHVRGEVPAELGQIGRIDEVTLDLNNSSILPEWLEKVEIRKINITGDITEEQYQNIKRRFKNAEFSYWIRQKYETGL